MRSLSFFNDLLNVADIVGCVNKMLECQLEVIANKTVSGITYTGFTYTGFTYTGFEFRGLIHILGFRQRVNSYTGFIINVYTGFG